MLRMIYAVSLALIIVSLSGCHSFYKTIRVQPWDFYGTDLHGEELHQYSSIWSDTDVLLRVEDPPEFAQLAIDIGGGFQYHGYTDKKLLKKWDALFLRFMDWKPEKGQSIIVSDSVDTSKHTGIIVPKKDVKFVERSGKKYLEFTSYHSVGYDDVVAYDEENVKKMRVLYSSLNNALVDK